MGFYCCSLVLGVIGVGIYSVVQVFDVDFIVKCFEVIGFGIDVWRKCFLYEKFYQYQFFVEQGLFFEWNEVVKVLFYDYNVLDLSIQV